jgi:hypothetical protein
MDIVRQVGFTAGQEHQINCVRLFLGVMFFSEICSINGTTLQDGITTGHNNNEGYILTLKKAIQYRPNTQSWKLWTQAITSIISDGKELKDSLGDWTTNHSRSRQWNAYQRNQSYKKMEIGNGESINDVDL